MQPAMTRRRRTARRHAPVVGANRRQRGLAPTIEPTTSDQRAYRDGHSFMRSRLALDQQVYSFPIPQRIPRPAERPGTRPLEHGRHELGVSSCHQAARASINRCWPPTASHHSTTTGITGRQPRRPRRASEASPHITTPLTEQGPARHQRGEQRTAPNSSTIAPTAQPIFAWTGGSALGQQGSSAGGPTAAASGNAASDTASPGAAHCDSPRCNARPRACSGAAEAMPTRAGRHQLSAAAGGERRATATAGPRAHHRWRPGSVGATAAPSGGGWALRSALRRPASATRRREERVTARSTALRALPRTARSSMRSLPRHAIPAAEPAAADRPPSRGGGDAAIACSTPAATARSRITACRRRRRQRRAETGTVGRSAPTVECTRQEQPERPLLAQRDAC